MRIPLWSLAVLLASQTALADLPRIFVTSTEGTGNLSSWPDAHGLAGLQAADEICRTAAVRGGLENPAEYIALLSDGNNDAYCRIHGFNGKRAAKCGQPVLPAGGGPWYRMDGLPALDRVEYAFPAAPAASYMPRHVLFNESGAAFAPPAPQAQSSYAFSSTRADGSLSHFAPTCANWSSASASEHSELYSAYYTFGDIAPGAWTCDHPARLMCLKRGQHGGPLSRRRPPSARMAFISSLKGSAYFVTWPAAGGTPGLGGADKICQQLAADALLPLAQTYKALLTPATGQQALDRFTHDGRWYRTDGVLIAASKAALLAGPLGAPLQIDERARPTLAFSHRMWTGSGANGAPGSHCSSWTQTPNGQTSAQVGHNWAADRYWSGESTGFFCNDSAALYCLADNDSLFMSGMQ